MVEKGADSICVHCDPASLQHQPCAETQRSGRSPRRPPGDRWLPSAPLPRGTCRTGSRSSSPVGRAPSLAAAPGSGALLPPTRSSLKAINTHWIFLSTPFFPPNRECFLRQMSALWDADHNQTVPNIPNVFSLYIHIPAHIRLDRFP